MKFVMIVGALVLLLFGIVGIVISLDEGRDVHPATIEGRGVETFGTNRSRPGVEVEQVQIRDHVTGDLESVEDADLYRAVGADGIGEPADLEVQTSDGAVTRVRFREKWYGTGASAAGVVFGAVVTLAGVFVLWRGVRRFRQN